MLRKRGRPRKDIDIGVIFHMLKNKASITAVAKHIGIHRDTIYANFRTVIHEARISNKKAWREIMDAHFEKLLEKKRLKQRAKKRGRYFF